MKAMDGENVGKFLAFLDREVASQWEERSTLKGKGMDELAYHCKMRASQTEAVKAVFLRILNNEPSPYVDDIKKIFGDNVEIIEP